MGGIFNTINNNLYHYAGNNPVKFVDPNGCWQDKSQKITYNKKGVTHSAELNKGKVTKGDTLVKLAESQLKNEQKTNKFTSADVQKKVASIKSINGLKNSNIQIGQELVLGISNDRITDEIGIVDKSSHTLIAIGGIYGLYKAGAAGVSYAAARFLATDVGVKTYFAIGSVSFAIKEGIKNEGAILYSISRIPHLGGAILQFGPQLNQVGNGAIRGFTPGAPSLDNMYQLGGWGAATLISDD
jgi:LysM repeat protein